MTVQVEPEYASISCVSADGDIVTGFNPLPAVRRDYVRVLHLHFVSGNTPFSGIKVKFLPFSRREVGRSGEYQRLNLQRGSHYKVTAIGIHQQVHTLFILHFIRLVGGFGVLYGSI
jgi:hypothetical protein